MLPWGCSLGSLPGASPRSLPRGGITHPAALIHTLTTAYSQLSGRLVLRLLPLLGLPIHAGSVAGPLRPGPVNAPPVLPGRLIKGTWSGGGRPTHTAPVPHTEGTGLFQPR